MKLHSSLLEIAGLAKTICLCNPVGSGQRQRWLNVFSLRVEAIKVFSKVASSKYINLLKGVGGGAAALGDSFGCCHLLLSNYLRFF